MHGKYTGIAGAERFTIRGSVIEHITKVEKWLLFFNTTYHGIRIKLNPEQILLSEKKYGKIYPLNGVDSGVSLENVISLFLDDSKLKEKKFPIGTEVAVTFAKGSPSDQFFRGSEAIMIIDCVKVEEGVVFEDELLPVQLEVMF